MVLSPKSQSRRLGPLVPRKSTTTMSRWSRIHEYHAAATNPSELVVPGPPGETKKTGSGDGVGDRDGTTMTLSGIGRLAGSDGFSRTTNVAHRISSGTLGTRHGANAIVCAEAR